MKLKNLFLLIFFLVSCTPATPNPKPDPKPTITPTVLTSIVDTVAEATPIETPAPKDEIEIQVCAETDYEIDLIEYSTPNGGPENTQDMGAYIRDIFSASLTDGRLDYVLYIKGIESQLEAKSFVIQIFEADKNGFLKMENGNRIAINEYKIEWDGNVAQITIPELAIGDKLYARLKPISGAGCDALTVDDIQSILTAIQNGEKYAYIRIGQAEAPKVPSDGNANGEVIIIDDDTCDHGDDC